MWSVVFATSLIFAFHLAFIEGGGQSRQCTYHGYTPGGAIPQINSLIVKKPPEFEETVLEKALEHFNMGGGAATAGLDMLDAFGTALTASPKVAAVLGVISVASGFLGNGPPGPQDILDRAQQSIEALAKDVDVRLNQMQDYVDAKVLKLERRLMTRTFKVLSEKWANCVKKPTRKASDKCQRDAEQAISESRFEFQTLQSLFDIKDGNGKPRYNPNFSYRYVGTWQWMEKYKGSLVWYPSYDEVKQLEVGLIPFRNFASLHLLVLKTLVETFKDETGKEACGWYKYYLKEMKYKADYYIRYVKWAYEWIYIRQYEENMYFGVPGRAGGGPGSQKRGGFLGTIKCSGDECTVECSQAIKDNVCTFTKKRDSSIQAQRICEKYLGQAKKELSEFWKEQVLNVADTWKKYLDDAKQKLSANKCQS